MRIATGATGLSDAGLPSSGASIREALRAEIALASKRRSGQPVRVLDVGGGTGVWAVPMAQAGCQVTVVDTSLDALAALHGRAREAGVAERVSAVQADVQMLADAVPADAADLVLGHGLLEVVDDLAASVNQLAMAVAPGGAVSVVAAGRFGTALAQVHAGRLAQARAVLSDPTGRFGPTDPLRRRLDVATLSQVLEATGRLRVEHVRGDGVFEGWLPTAVEEAEPSMVDELAELEEAVANTPELLVLAARVHVMARRTTADEPSRG